jgi:geranylgeranyl diphosphate synthase, type II
VFDLRTYLADQKQRIDRALMLYIQKGCPSEHIYGAVHYAVMAGGKRLRPVLCLAAAATGGADFRQAMPAACAIEMIHTYSLIHDDLPALDNDRLRRGKPTCHVQFSEATAILAGDALLNLAFEVLSDAGLQSAVEKCRSWLQVIDIIGRASGARGMIDGQARDLAFEGVRLEPNALQALHELKTGALIRAAVHCGGLLGDASRQQIANLKAYADRIGLAFQVIDDILNVTGDPQVLGKAVGTDQERQKNTYPALLGLEQSRQLAVSLIDSALQALNIFDTNADPLRAIAKYIIERER